MKTYINGKRRRFRKSVPADGRWHHIVVVDEIHDRSFEIRWAKVTKRTRALEIVAKTFPAHFIQEGTWT